MVGIFPLGPRDLLRQPFLVKRLGFRTHTLFFFDLRELLENCFQLKGQVIFGRFCILFQPSILHCFLKFSGSSFLQRCYSSLLSLSILTTVKMFISFLRSFFFSPLFFSIFSGFFLRVILCKGWSLSCSFFLTNLEIFPLSAKCWNHETLFGPKRLSFSQLNIARYTILYDSLCTTWFFI